MSKPAPIDSDKAMLSVTKNLADLLTPFVHGKPWHMQHSGYEALVDFMPNSRVINCYDFRRLSRLSYPLRLAHVLPQSYISLDAEATALRGNGKVLHHLYGEDTLWLSLFAKARRSRSVVATFHRPPKLLEADMPFFWKKKIRSLAGLIALSPDQSAYLRSVCGTETRVALIPHGIDTSLYAPRDDLRSSELLLSVGNHLRDFTTVLKAMQILANVAPTLKLVVISTPAVSCFSGIQNIISIENISDEDLINYYRRASFAVLPFDALVASNAMLEGMAFGMPIVCPDSDAARYYLGADIQTMYKPADPKSLVEKILWLHRNDRERRFLCSAMRERAEQFAWSKVCEQIIAFYEEILDQHDEIAS